MEDYDKTHWANKGCPKYDCRKAACKCGLKFVDIPAILGDDSEGNDVAPKNGEYCNAIVRYEANGRVYIYSKEGVPVLAGSDIESLEKMIKKEILDRQGADNVLQQEIDDLKNSPDVVDIVATYADLQAYDTSKLGDNDIIRVLADETHDGDSTYYRWSTSTSSWTYIGGISIVASTIFYADKSETDSTRHIYKDAALTEMASYQDILDANEKGQVILRKFVSQTPERYGDVYLQRVSMRADGYYEYALMFLGNFKYYNYFASGPSATVYNYTESGVQGTLTAGTNVTITGYTISATDTTYSDFTGTDGVDPGTAGLVPAPATTDAGKFLKSDGTWDTAGGGGPTVVQTKGTSTTDVMSQDATTKLIYPDITNYPYQMLIGEGSIAGTNKGLAINGVISSGLNNGSIAIGATDGNPATIGASGRADQSIAIGGGASVERGYHSVVIGTQAYADSGQNEGSNVAIGYNSYAGYGTAKSSVALGPWARTTRTGEVNVGTGIYNMGYNSTDYRVIGGVHDGQDLHDAATVAQGNTLATTAPDTSTVGVLGQLWTDTTNMHTYQCTTISGSTYTWTQRW